VIAETAADPALMSNELKSAIYKVQKNEDSNLILADRDIDDSITGHLKFLKNLSAALEDNRALRKLDLSENNIGDAGVSVLAGALQKNTGLRRLDLSGNDEIDCKGAVDMANALKKNRSLVNLNLSHSQVGDEAAKAFGSMFAQNSTLQTLNLSCCLIHGEGAEALLSGLEKNSTLQTLNLEDNPELPAALNERILQMLTKEARAERRQQRRATIQSALDEEAVEPSSPSRSSPKSFAERTALEVHETAPWLPVEICTDLVDSYQKNSRKKVGVFHNTAQRGILVHQLMNLRDLIKSVLGGPEIIDTQAPDDSPTKGQPLRWDTLSMYQVNDYFTKALTQSFNCSWVEFVAADRQPPQWMISHAWKTPFPYTLAMVCMHAKARSADLWHMASYWCCTFANNQHDLSELDEQDIMVTPFARVLLSHRCLGTLLLCNPQVTPLKRVWCVFETHITAQLQAGELTQKRWHLLDVAVPVAGCSADGAPFKVTLLQDAGNGNFLERSDTPGTYFPLEVAHVGTEVDICNAEASRVEDRNCILNYVATETCSREIPPETHTNYTKLNLFIHRTFASAELYRLATQRPADLAGIARLLELRGDPTRFVRNGNTAIHAAVGADPTSVSSDLSNSVELLEMLLTAGSDPNVVNSQLCTALDYASKQSEHAKDALCPILKKFGAKPFDAVAPEIESDMNALLSSIVARGFNSEGTAFGGRTLGDTDARLMWPARHALQLVATNLCLYPHGTFHISIQEACFGGMSASEFAKTRAKAEQRGVVILRLLRSAGCVNPIEVTSARQETLLNVAFTFGRTRPKLPLLASVSDAAQKDPKLFRDAAREMAKDSLGIQERGQQDQDRFMVNALRISAQSPAGSGSVQARASVSSTQDRKNSNARPRRRSPFHSQKRVVKTDVPDLSMIASNSPCHGTGRDRSASLGAQVKPKSPAQREPRSPSLTASEFFLRRRQSDRLLEQEEVVGRRHHVPRPSPLTDIVLDGQNPTNGSSSLLLQASASDGFLSKSSLTAGIRGPDPQRPRPPSRSNESASEVFLPNRPPSNTTTVARMSSTLPLIVGSTSNMEISGSSLRPRLAGSCLE